MMRFAFYFYSSFLFFSFCFFFFFNDTATTEIYTLSLHDALPIAGILVAPRLFLDVNLMGGVLVYAFAAATLGGFDSALGAVLGGWIIGVSENLAATYVNVI